MVLFFVFSLLVVTTSADVFNPSEILSSIESIQLDSLNTVVIKDMSIEYHDIKLHLKEGNLIFVKPTYIESKNKILAAYFEGSGQVQYKPSNIMEREQLNRYTKFDSLNQPFSNILLLFSPYFYEQKFENLEKTKFVPNEITSANFKNSLDYLVRDSQNLFTLELLKSTINPIGDPFLSILINTDYSESFLYTYNPYLSEELKLFKSFTDDEKSFFGLINSYSQYSLDESYRSINGLNKSQFDITHYDIDASVNKEQDYISKVIVRAKVLSGPARIMFYDLSETVAIDSIKDDNLGKVYFYDKSNTGTAFDRTRKVGVVLNSEYNYGDTLKLTFYLSGKVGEKDRIETIMYAGTNWYPRYNYSERAIYDMTLRSDEGTHIIGSGIRLERDKSDDTLITKWRVIPAANNVTFLISDLLKYRIEDQNKYEEEKLNPIDIYYSRKVHQRIADYREAEKVGIEDSIEYQISEDILNSIRVYKYYFNSAPKNILAVTETFYKRRESISNLIMLGFDTWIRTDPFGVDRMYRSHEVARQWWGVDVCNETYHDKWITDGLSLYSSLLYVQRMLKNKVFMEKVQEFQDAVYSGKHYVTGIEAEVGPIALGHRTSYLSNPKPDESAYQKKSALIFHMLRNLLLDFKTMSDERFTAMLREFYQRYRGKNVNTAQFQQIVEKYAGIKMDWFFKQWVYGTDIPEYDFSYVTELIPSEGYKISGHVITENVADDFKMYVPLQIEFENGNKAIVRLLIDSKDYSFSLPNLPNRPKTLILNPFESVLARIKQ